MNWCKISLILLAAALLACDDESRPTPPLIEQHFPTESDLQLSPDGDYIYYVTVDSLAAVNTGIYRAQVLTPIRQKILAGIGFSSPTLSPDNRTLAYLDSGVIKFYDLITHATSQFPSGFLWDALAFVDTDLLVAGRDSSIELITRTPPSAALLGEGFEPKRAGDSIYIYSANLDDGFLAILTKNYVNGVTDTLLKTMLTGTTPPILSPSKHRTNDHLVFSIRHGAFYDIYSARGDTLTLLAQSPRPGVEIVTDGLILFTGENGLIYHTSIAGGTPQPWIHVEDSD